MGARAIGEASKSAEGLLDHIVLAFPRQDERLQAFSEVFTEANVALPQCSSESSSVAPQVDVNFAKWDLLGSLHCDTMANAVAAAQVDTSNVGSAVEAKRIAQRWLHEVARICIEELRSACTDIVLERVQKLLSLESNVDLSLF